VRRRFESDEKVDVVDIELNNPVQYVPINDETDYVCFEDGKKTIPMKYNKLPTKCPCGSVFNKATKSRHEATQKHKIWKIKNQIENGHCPFCKEYKCQTHSGVKLIFGHSEDALKIAYDADGNEL